MTFEYKNNPEYKHYLEYKRRIPSESIPELIKICKLIIGDQNLKELYEKDNNLNNLKGNSQVVKNELNRRKEERLLKLVRQFQDKKISYKVFEVELYKIKDTFNVFVDNSWYGTFDAFIQRVVNLVGGSISLADNTCILKHVMKYHILKVKRPGVMIKTEV